MKKSDIRATEERRKHIQSALDALKTSLSRNKLGQFSTPSPIAEEMVAEALIHVTSKNQDFSFLDPSIGTGVFFSEILSQYKSHSKFRAVGFEIDPHYGVPSAELWSPFGLELRLECFLSARIPTTDSERFSLVACNPPYVRHQHISKEDKLRFAAISESASGYKLSGLSGLYCHFLLSAHKWMKEDAVGIWIIPSEFMDVNYGTKVKDYLATKVELIRIHRYNPEDSQFPDALVSSAIVLFRNRTPSSDTAPIFSFGGSLRQPSTEDRVSLPILKTESKWTRFPQKGQRSTTLVPTLADLFSVKRGIATGANKFFIISESAAIERGIPRDFLTPILPSPRSLKEDHVTLKKNGSINVKDPQYLLNCRLDPSEVSPRYPALARYLSEGEKTAANGYLCQNRKVWYHQEIRPAAPLLCTYLGRTDGNNRPFRFILNETNATATNVYLLLYPTKLLEDLIESGDLTLKWIWEQLNSLPVEALLDEGRVYGGGLHKLEPKELKRVRLHFIQDRLRSLG